MVNRIAVVILTLAFSLPFGLTAKEIVQPVGTAFVVHSDGFLLTCLHVVKNAKHLQVVIDGKSYDALIFDMDEQHDLALLEIKAKGLTALPLGDSDAVQVGEEVRVCGFPLANVLGETVKINRGTISGIDIRNKEKAFQIDAAVNRGNSGGPLVNERGEVIGITNAKLSGLTVSSVGFAVPINFVKHLLREQGVVLTTQRGTGKLDGPTLARQVSPAIALLTCAVNVADTPVPPPAPLELVATLAEYKRLVTSLAFSPDGLALVTGANDRMVGLWDAKTGALKKRLIAHKSPVSSIVFSVDGNLLASGGLDQTIQLWDVTKAEWKSTLGWHTAPINALAFSRDGQTLAAATGPPAKPGAVEIWDVPTGKLRRSFRGHLREITSVAISPDDKFIASAGRDKTVHLWNADGKLLYILKGHRDEATAVAFTADSAILVSASKDSTLILWDVRTGQQLHTLRGHLNEITTIAFSKDGQTMASAGQDNTVKLWNTVTWEVRRTITGPTGGIIAIALTPDGKTLATATKDNAVKLWDLTEPKQ